MPTAPDSFSAWIARLPQWHGWLQLSPERPYAHAEEEYDNQYGVTAPEPEDGEGLCNLLKTHGVDTRGPALEIGCGTGRLTYGLARHYPGPDFLVTDPSQTFLRITQTQLGDPAAASTQLHFAMLNADDLGQLPPEMFSVIAMRSTLHHILRVEEFIAACGRTLRPGGALVMGAEPVESGYVLMGAVGQSIAPVLQAAGITVRPEWTRQINDLTDTVKFYCRRDINKKTAEDKHLFREHEMADLGQQHGLQLKFFPNAAFSNYVAPYVPEFETFSHFFLNYLQFCMLYDAEFLELIRRHLKPQLKYLDDCYRSHVGPTITGVFLLKKNAGQA
ncbi:MAG: class I SAM-dependent methyltransferase [Lacunisphaera sp.]|nr:class I SAM-dependent methyltransferase [Lacunisphaera sp.]